MSSPDRPTMRARREPPQFRLVTVRRVEQVSPRMIGVTLCGADLESLAAESPAASVRLLLPSPGALSRGGLSRGAPSRAPSSGAASPGAGALVMPTWNGNEFLLPDGQRPIIRTFTPRRVGTDTETHTDTLDLEIVIHGNGVASQWAETAQFGDPAAVSGPGRGYAIDRDAPAFLLAGDESAIPAISQLLECLPAATPVQVHIEVAHSDGRLALPDHPGSTVQWHDLPPDGTAGDALVVAICSCQVLPGTRVWTAGEAAAVQRIRRHLFEDRGLPRSHATIRGYWKHGRGGDTDDDA